jgi:hypothetical protein
VHAPRPTACSSASAAANACATATLSSSSSKRSQAAFTAKRARAAAMRRTLVSDIASAAPTTPSISRSPGMEHGRTRVTLGRF